TASIIRRTDASTGVMPFLLRLSFDIISSIPEFDSLVFYYLARLKGNHFCPGPIYLKLSLISGKYVRNKGVPAGG
ncbi:MAG: hypothetical protein ABEK01_05590, partial [Candidatus Nanohaloarchaea archaeon]